jgi:23S rRNA (adenine2503-C2)-methyltransferase
MTTSRPTVPLAAATASPKTGGAPAGLGVLGMTSEEYVAACAAAGVRGGRAGALERYTALFRRGLSDQPGLSVAAPAVLRRLTSESAEGTTLKFTLPAAGAGRAGAPLESESVLIPMVGRKGHRTYTLCVSSQVGCAMGCAFCQTAQMGLLRSLSAAEIVAQWFAATHALGHAVSNLVFMGMGEPLDNLDEVLRAIAVLTDHRGAGLPMSKIVVSTVGRLDGLARLAEQVRRPGWRRLNLAVSLNAPDDRVRSAIMPINRAMPLGALRRALEAWPIYGGAKICLEYVLIPGVNDAPDHARLAAAFVRGSEPGAADPGPGRAVGPWEGPPLKAMINVIPYNPRDRSPWRAPTEEEVDRFLAALLDHGVYAKRRRTKGRETMAACGQLGNPALRRRRSPPLSEGGGATGAVPAPSAI